METKLEILQWYFDLRLVIIGDKEFSKIPNSKIEGPKGSKGRNSSKRDIFSYKLMDFTVYKVLHGVI